MRRTIQLTTRVSGPSSATTQLTGRETASEKPSGRAIAADFGSTSPKMTTITVMPIVA